MHEDSEPSRIQPRGWRIRSRSGAVRQVRSLAHMALLILDGKVDPRDEISAGESEWTPLADVIDTEELAKTLQALGHLGHDDLAA